jgi:acetyl/propionyl-CoA carboxylase alpha subunit
MIGCHLGFGIVYESVLVADRGETARRVIRTVRALGMKAVAVYAAADSAARHVHEADEAVLLGRGPQDAPYRDIRALIEAAQRSGCEAVHPGCGALASSPSFADAVAEGGLVWVGPAPRTLAAIADPAVLAGALSTVGVAFAGSTDVVDGSALAVTVVAGDGDPVGLPPRELVGPGRPVIECPVPDLARASVAALVRAAEQAARVVELRGLATVTLVAGGGRNSKPVVAAIWPALDVEHPVVEAVTGLDLVEQQIRISTGETPEQPATTSSRTAALAQVRATSERRRATKISRWREPERDDIRIDSGYAAGDSVPPGGARVLATITGWGTGRDEALAALGDALDTFEIAGTEADVDAAQQEVARRRAPRPEEQGT